MYFVKIQTLICLSYDQEFVCVDTLCTGVHISTKILLFSLDYSATSLFLYEKFRPSVNFNIDRGNRGKIEAFFFKRRTILRERELVFRN
jgi:hypothetical protein